MGGDLLTDPDTLGEIMADRLRKQYNRIRKLENAIRQHAEGRCKCRGPHECISALHKIVPLDPRPTLEQAHKRAKKQRKERG